MENKKELQVRSKDVLEKINSVYLQNIEELQSYLPKNESEKLNNLEPEAKKEIINTGRRMTSGIKSSIPMKCKGKDCCLSSRCSLLKNDVAPIDYLCPYEEFMVDKLTAEYYTTLEVDPFNRVERDLIKQMVELIIIDNRTSADISNNGLYMQQAVGATNKGEPIYSTIESIAYTIKIKTQIRIEKLQNELLATRKVKKQLDVNKKDDPSSKSANLFERFQEFVNKNKIENANIEIIDEPKESSPE